jgi:hypothetical protein
MDYCLIISNIASVLAKKFKRATHSLAESELAFQGLTQSLSHENILDWQRQEQEALSQRGDALKIYEVQVEKGLHTDLSFVI